MTPPVDDPETLRRILANTDALLLDFDGPICSVFSGMPAPIVADQLRAILAEGGHTHLPANIATATDPFGILFYAATLGPDEARYIEAAFTAHEVEAIQTAKPTPGAHNLIASWHETGQPLVIVSNNSAAAVESYLAIHGIANQIDYYSARTGADISLLKPSPFLVDKAIVWTRRAPNSCVLVGDSITDVQAGHAAGATVIGYANKIGKSEHLGNAGADAVIGPVGLRRLAQIVSKQGKV